MLDMAHWSAYCLRLGFSRETVAVLDAIRAAPPSRTPRSGLGNVPVWYPSKKMGCTIKAESRTVEFSFLQEAEYSDDVLEFYDQPPRIPLRYATKNGRAQCVWHTPDYFVIRQTAAGWEECKPEKALHRLADVQPNRYQRDTGGVWHCPPGEAYATSLGLSYRVRSSQQINWVAQSNWLYLEDYYRRRDALAVTPEARATVLALVEAEPGITLAELRHRIAPVTTDNVHALLALGELYVDLARYRLAEPECAPVYCRKPAVHADDQVDNVLDPRRPMDEPHVVVLEPGALVQWDGVPWTIMNVGAEVMSLLSDARSLISLPRAAFESLVRDGAIVGTLASRPASMGTAGRELLARAGEAALAKAVCRAQFLAEARAGDVRSTNVAARTLRRWEERWRAAEVQYGSGFLGLLPRYDRCGRGEQIADAVRDLLHAVLKEYHDTSANRMKRGAYGEFLLQCDERGYTAPSEGTFYREARRHMPAYDQTLARGGRRVAYRAKEFHHPEQRTVPPHGEHAWAVAHLDHTELDLELVSAATGQVVGRPWLSLLIGGVTRTILAHALSFDQPSYRSCLLVLRDCVHRHGRLPQALVVDGGAEFRSTYFETLLARYEVTKRQRPPHEPRFGAVLERLFASTQTEVIYHLLGNTQLTHQQRQITRATDPKAHACWTLAALAERLERWAYAEYATLVHPTLGQSPNEAYARSMQRDGARSQRLIPYDEDFLLATYASTPKGTAMVQAGRGVQIHHILYWSDAMRDPEIERTAVAVRYDPFDVTVAYARIRGSWRRCHSAYAAELAGCSERELMLLAEELRQRQRNACAGRTVELTQRQLAAFRRSNQQIERVLQQQRRDAEAREMMTRPVGADGVGEQHTAEAARALPGAPSRQAERPLLRLDRFQ